MPLGFRAPAQLWLLGTTRDEFGGSEWAWHLHRHLGGRPPAVDLAAEQRLAELLHRAAEQALLCAAHDVSDGGLAQALVEGCVLGDVGARVRLSPDIDPVVALFSESAGRAVVATLPAHASALQCLASECSVPCTPLGEVGGTALELVGARIPVTTLRAARDGTLPQLMS
jgi:phosphoribosylformylglycinamidine synthase